MVEITLVDIKSLSIIIFWLPPKSLSPLCVADESVKNILGTCVGWRILIITHVQISVYIISSIPKGKDDLQDLKLVQGPSLHNNKYTQSDNLATCSY